MDIFNYVKNDKVFNSLHAIDNKAIDLTSLRDFIHLGYVTGNRTIINDATCNINNSKFEAFSNISEHFLLSSQEDDKSSKEYILNGASIWNKAIERCLNSNSKKIVVPISGGLDSRLILGSLLEHVSPSEITTYTFGIPGSFDYEIGNLVAKAVGTKHFSYDLNKIEVTEEKLKFFMHHTLCNSDLFTGPPLTELLNDIEQDSIIWSGFMGDPSIGSHLPSVDAIKSVSGNFIENKEDYSRIKLLSQKLTKKNIIPPFYNFENVNGEDSKIELWDLQNRQSRYVTSQVFIKPFEYEVPFINRDWLAFSLRLPKALRRNELFYKEFLINRYSSIFNLPVKCNLGTPLKSSLWSQLKINGQKAYNKVNKNYLKSKNINYVNFDQKLRENKPFYDLCSSLLCSFGERQYIDSSEIAQILQLQRSGVDCSRAFTLLASIELILQKNRLR
ncbi:MAG: hypothetical protein ACJAS9_002059 [Polaribacter sp.]|jgi:hypothetical protein